MSIEIINAFNGDNLIISNFTFPGGERHIKIANALYIYSVHITSIIHNSDDIIDLLLGVDAVRRELDNPKITLEIPYLPYARQDRVCSGGDPFSLKVICDLINSLNAHAVYIFDPHSKITEVLINNCRPVYPPVLFRDDRYLYSLGEMIKHNSLSILYPDQGAQKKITELCMSIYGNDYRNYLLGASKFRDANTGEITATEVYGEVENKDIIIIDDICDGGRTFIELAKVLKYKRCGKLYLCVTHGIFSKGLDELNKYFEHIYCYHQINSYIKNNDKFTCIEEVK